MAVATYSCRNCGNGFNGNYCNHCGEKVYKPQDKSIGHIVEEGFHFISHLDGTFFTTLKTMFSQPGQLSYDYTNGKRKRYFKPISFFLLLVLFYLLFPLFDGLNMELKYYFDSNVYGSYAKQKATSILAEKNWSNVKLAEEFHQKAEKVSKYLLLLIIPLTALFFWLCTFKRKKYFFDQMIFSAEVNAVYLLWGFLILPVLIWLTEAIYKLFSGVYFPFNDTAAIFFTFIPLFLFVVIAGKKFYRLSNLQSFLLAAAFIITHNYIVHVVYKFILFTIVINQIH